MDKNPELLILTAIVANRCLDEVLKAGLRPDHFGMPTTKEAFEYLLSFRKEAGQAGAIPTMSQFRRKFPWFQSEMPPSATTPTSLTKEMMEVSLQREVATGVFDLKEKQGSTTQDVEKLIGQLKDLLARHKTLELAGAAEATALVETWYELGGENSITGLPYPWSALNNETRGVQTHDFILIFGRPKSTKTWQLLRFLSGLQDHLVLQGTQKPILFVSFEMDLQRLTNRLACIKGRVSYERFNKKTLSGVEYGNLCMGLTALQLSKERGVPIYFAGPAICASGKKGFSMLDIEQAADEVKPAAIFIDGLLHAADIRTGKKSREWSVISNISSDVKQMSLSLHCPVIATHQANRESEVISPVNTQRDIAYADALAQDCDLTLRITKLRATTKEPRMVLMQPEGAREFELLGFTTFGDLCENMEYKETITEEKSLRQLLKRAAVEDPVEEARQKSSGSKGGKSVSKMAQEAAAAKQDQGTDLTMPAETAAGVSLHVVPGCKKVV
jgi:replicative DNA helicase